MRIKGSTALVTGGALRVGRAICLELAAQGCHLVVHYRESAAAAEALVGEMQGLGVRAYTVSGPLDTEDDCEQVFASARRLAGPLDILVNNASIFERQALLDTRGDDYDRHWRINCLGPVLLTGAFARDRAPHAAARAGVVINLLDRRVAEHPEDCMPYLLSKKALAAFTLSAARGLHPHVRVNGVAPGAVLPAVETGQEQTPGEPFQARASVDDIARAVVTLVEADGVSGRIVYVGGSPA